ncbi:molybdopterin molybdenumtransferase [Anaerobacillus alkalidiazotrophicus]|uniref:Molybdopterin molybdenumtransferase n=1 Tax=Anaerobacillus alkalidiazotrophicus TaxID=472963 RepID=A0A1S2M5N1_9BACI|nr:gephyrin-like molybdotransferase Glp [Anaerobacillus alkalidiazotrophicus]OIJ18455.1 molybdopterin molybdenumtransferase [Anaerobacillus alkalidiazotrophicus]OIJ19934.1 molybdopterin molybdenumtransferase [Anaerobacillus alkalidiazotrophicus]
MLTDRKPIKIHEAIEAVLKFSKEGEIEYIPIEESDNRILKAPIKADHDIPPFDRSPLDGFAVRAEDTVSASSANPIELEVIETVGAGGLANSIPQKGQAIRIMTGAKMPEGTDAIVMFELTKEIERNGKTFVSISRKFIPGDNISFQGEETRSGDVLVEAGRQVEPGVKALLATFGYSKVPVAKKPTIGVYATGTELLDVHEELKPGKIRNSNSYMITSQIIKTGAIPRYFGKLVDDFDRCFEAVKNALEEVDVLITTGGVSVGDFDYLPAIYEKLGANVLFNKVGMRPGSVTTVAEYNGKLLFGLSGNPSACFVGFELFVRPWVQIFLGSKKPHLQMVHGELKSDFPKANPFVRFIRSKMTIESGKVFAEPVGLDKSGVVTSLANSDALVVLPGGTRGFQKGDTVTILLLNGEGGTAIYKEKRS